MLPLLRCPFVDFFGSLASRGFPSYLSLPSEGRDAIGASRGLSSPARLGPAGGVGEPLVARLVHTSSLLSPWFIRGLRDTGVALLRRTPVTFYVRLALPPHLCTFDEVMGWESGSERFWLCSQLSLPPHLCTLGEVVRRVRFSSAAPVRFPPWSPDLRLERQGGYLSPLLVEWLSFAVLLLALSLRLPCLVKRSRRCERGSSR